MSDKAKIFSMANQKGGVGKTTCAINIAAALGILKRRVLLLDFDPQGNCSTGMGVLKKNSGVSSFDIVSGAAEASQAIRGTKFEGVDIIPATMELAGAELLISDRNRREFVLSDALDKAMVKEKYDAVIIDCPPSLGLLTLNAMVCSDMIIVPMQCEYFALEGLSQLTYTLNKVQKLYNPSLSLGGVILTMYDGRLNLSIQVAREVQRFFPGKVFKSTIPRGVRVSEAPSFGQPVVYYDRNCKPSSAYLEIAREMISKFKI
ncbi:MAG: ParA family protein [Oscillospiraceae bacterium]|nr:ParA family protein [Oscillospiraceae bacterium]